MSRTRTEVDRGSRGADYARLRDQLLWGLERVRALRAVREQEGEGSPPVALAAEEAIALHLARLGSLVLDLAGLWVLEERLGIPRRETEALDLLVKAGKLPLDRGRRLRMLSDYRLSVGRDLSRQDRTAWSSGREGGTSPLLLSELALFEEWAEEVADGLGLPLP